MAQYEAKETHQRLGPSQYRLFTLETSVAPESDSPFICHLHLFSHQEPKPKYKALSYTCGQPYRSWNSSDETSEDRGDWLSTRKHKPLLFVHDGGGLRLWAISPNLLDLLHQLRHNGATGFLWADAICIKQDDLTERASQVSQMSLIYQNATEVLIWLGPNVEHTKSFVEIVNLILPEVSQKLKTRDHQGQNIYLTTMNDTELISKVDLEKLKSFARFCYMCRWFERIWTMQERMLATTKRVLCGSYQVDWENLMSCLQMTRKLGWANHLAVLISDRPEKPFQWNRRIQKMCFLDSLYIYLDWDPPSLINRAQASLQTEESLSLAHDALRVAHILKLMNSADCEDDLDRIFGALGVIRSSLKDSSISALMPAIDYTQSAEDLYEAVSRRVLQHSDCLDLLPYASRHLYPLSSLLPSWVTDHRQKPLATPLWQCRSPRQNPFDASAGLLCHGPRLHFHNRNLGCVGIRFDFVVDTAIVPLWEPSIRSADLLAFLVLVQRTRIPPKIALPLTAVLWLTCTADLPLDTDLLFSLSPQEVFLQAVSSTAVQMAFVEDLSADEALNFFSNVAGELSRFQDGPDLPLVEFRKEVKNHYLTFVDYLEGRLATPPVTIIAPLEGHLSGGFIVGRMLFLTAEGLLGLGTVNMKAGDEIWVLSGASTPMVLRPAAKDAEYYFVGDCFILDHMHGEVAAQMDDVEEKMRRICIV